MMKLKDPAVDTLSFVQRRKPRGSGYDYWANVPSRGSYGEDTTIGKDLAVEYLAFIGKYPTFGNGSLLGPIVLDMEENGATKGHKIGFLNTIGKYALVGAYLEVMGSERKPFSSEDK